MLAIAGCSEDNTHPKVSPVDEPSADAVTILATIDAIPSATGDGEAYAPLWQEGDQIIVGYKGMSYVYETYDAGNGVEFHPVALSLPADARGTDAGSRTGMPAGSHNKKRLFPEPLLSFHGPQAPRDQSVESQSSVAFCQSS